jgi:hypothetical protein
VSAVGFRNLVKILVRSRSLRFTADMVRQSPTSSLARLRWSGRDIFYRSGTADPFVLYQVLLRSGKKAEYYVPPGLRPKSYSTSAATSALPLFIFIASSPTPTFLGSNLIPTAFESYK